MSVKSRLPKQKRGGIKYITIRILKTVLMAIVLSLFTVSVSIADDPIKPMGSAGVDITIWVPDNSVKTLPVLATAYYQAEADLPEGVTFPPNIAGQAIDFGIWQGDGTSHSQFSPSVVINIEYEDDDIPEAARPDEQFLYLHMYNPATQSWIKLCGSVDIHENVVSAALSFPTPYEENGSSLLALAIDSTPVVEQVLDDIGTTIILAQDSDLRLQIPSQAVRVGVYFAITLLPRVSNTDLIRLPTKPIDIKACWVDRDNPTENNRQIVDFSSSLQVGFDYDSDTLSRAGSQTNLTIGKLQNRLWIDVEEVGSRVTRNRDTVSVDTGDLGIFGLAIR